MRKLWNQVIALVGLALQGLRAHLGGNLAIAAGVLVATVTICSSVLYAQAVNIAVLRDRLAAAHAAATYDLIVKGGTKQIDAARYAQMDKLILEQVTQSVGLPIRRLGRHGWSRALSIVGPGVWPSGQYNDLPRVRFQFYAGLADHIELVAGTYPQPASSAQDIVEVMATQTLADQLQLRVGDEFSAQDFVGGEQPQQVRARLSGIFRLKGEPAQRSEPGSPTAGITATQALTQPAAMPGGSALYAPRFLDEALTVPEESFFRNIALNVAPNDGEVTWIANYDETAVTVDNIDRVMGGLDLLQFNLTRELRDLQFLTNMDDVLQEYRRSTFLLLALLAVLGAPVILIALYYILLAAGLLVQQRQSEIAVVKSRGGSDGQVLGMFLVQGLVIAGSAALLAPLLAVPLAQAIGRATSFLEFSNNRLLPATLRPDLFGFAALAALLALFAILAPTWQAARQTIVTYRRSAARENRPLFVHRFYLDFVLVLLGALGYWQLTRSGTIIQRGATGGLEFDPLLLLTPIVLVAGLTFLALRVVPVVVRGLAALVGGSDAVAPLFGLRQVARTPARYNGLILILVFTLALGLFTAAIAGAFDRNYADQAMYAAGADLRTHEFDYDTASWRVRPVAAYLALPGVQDAAPTARVKLIGRDAQIAAQGTLLAVDAPSLLRVAWWRNDFAPSGDGSATLAQVLAPLATSPSAVLADRDFIRKHGLRQGDTFDIDIEGRRVDFTLAGQIGYFPTLYPEDGDRLIANLDYLSRTRDYPANEMWLKTAAGSTDGVIEALKRSAENALVVVDNGRELAGVRKEDPVRTGLFGALSLGFIAAAVLSVLGFLLYAYLTIQARALQFGVLRATGLSTGQLVGALATEQLTLIAAGLLIGTALGGAAGWMFTRFLQVSIIARGAVPPFLVETPWESILRLYGVLVVIFIAALAVSVILLRRMRVAAVLRLGEQ